MAALFDINEIAREACTASAIRLALRFPQSAAPARVDGIVSGTDSRARVAAFMFAQCLARERNLPTQPLPVPDGPEGDALVREMSNEGYTFTTSDDTSHRRIMKTAVGKTGRALHMPGCC
jgi:hypothetical protein